MTTRRTHRTMCPMNCHPTACGMVVEIEDDRVISVSGDRESPESRGFLCVRGRASAEIVDNPRRLLTPLLREHRGRDDWQHSTWDAALDRVAAGIEKAGPDATSVWAGHGVFVNGIGGALAARFASMLGAQYWNPSIVCWGLGGFGLWLTGVVEVNTAEDMARNADTIVLWGANLASQPTTAPRIVAARKRGARVIAIDVRDTEAFAHADETFRVRPGTDAALALAVMHVMVGEELYDHDFVSAHTIGFDELAGHVRQYTPEWAAAETGIEAARIVGLARTLAGTRRTTYMVGGSSMNKSGNGWHASRAIACLPALTGGVGAPGAGMGPRHAGAAHGAGLNSIVPPRPAGSPDPMISEMSSILHGLDEGRVKAILLLGSNIASSFADAGRVRRAMDRMGLVAAFDLFPNESIREHADVVLPGTSWLEETGIKSTVSHVHLMDRTLARRGEARPLWSVLRGLAERLGIDGFFPWRSADDVVDAMLDSDAATHTTVQAMREGAPHSALAVSEVGHPDLRFATPSGKVELVSARAAELGLPALPTYEPARENHVRAAAATAFPLVLTCGRALTHFHGFYDHGKALPSLAKADPETVLWLNPDDAARRGLEDGAALRIYNERGEMAAKARVTNRVPAGVTWMHDGWADLNRLTSGARSVPDGAARVFPAGQASYEARIEVGPA